MVDMEIALGHHLLQVPEAEPKPQVPTDTQDNELGFEMSSLKQCRPVRSHPLQGTRHRSTGLHHFPARRVGFSKGESAGTANLPKEFHAQLDLSRIVRLWSADGGLDDGAEIWVGRVAVELRGIDEKRVHHVETL